MYNLLNMEVRERRVRPGFGSVLVAVCAGLAGSCAGVGRPPAAVPQEESSAAQARGTLSVFLENDMLSNRDDEYTSGVGLRWTSGELSEERGPRAFYGLVSALDFLPKFASEDYTREVTLTLGQEMYTPTDINAPVPPPDEHPYAGILFLDTAVHSRGPTSLHSYNLRLGLVGPSSGAQQIQEAIHDWIGSPIPQGWDHQLSDEFLLNVDYAYHRRLVRREGGSHWGHDLTAQAGAGLGNYYVGADAGLVGRLGLRLPDTYGTTSLRGTGGDLVGSAGGNGYPWWGYLFGSASVFGVGRFLPTDGNTFKDSPSAERDDVFANLSLGLALGRGRFRFDYTLNNLGSLSEFQDSGASDYGTMALSWSF